jgi:hypothetical protein
VSWKPPLFFFARMAVAAFYVVSAIYCLLAYIPFTYQQVHVGGLLPWLTAFVRIHPYLNVAALALLVPTVWAELRDTRAKIPTIGLLAASAAGMVALFIHPVLANLTNDASSLGWCVVMLLPLVWVGVCDWLANGAGLQWRERQVGEEERLFRAAWPSALFCGLLYAAILYVHTRVTHGVPLAGRQWAWALLWSLASQVLVFCGIFVLLSLGVALAGMSRHWRSVEMAMVAAIAVGIVWLIFRVLVFTPLSFRGWAAGGIAFALGFAMVVFFTGTHVALCRRAPAGADSGLELLLWPLHFLRGWKLVPRLAFFAGLALITYWLATAAIAFDWEYLLQQLVAVALWVAAFGAFYMLAAVRPGKLRLPLVYGAALIVVVGYAGLQLAQPRRQEQPGRGAEVASLVDEYANYDVSFRLADQLLSGAGEANSSDKETAAFYSFLAANTDVARSRQIDPVDIKLVEKFGPPSADRPNIFVFVIDSLRRDYLGAYNPGVTFTPNFDAFAHNSAVMENAFTHYGGTGLSEPSIWVGGMMLHKQYITPFTPMNTLKKLVDAEDYDAYVSKDTILQTVLGPSEEIHELDANIGSMSYDFCRTLSEVEAKLPGRSSAGRPMFVYTQPQNIHVSVIDREGRSVPPGENYPTGFNPPYASRVAHLDGCFGGFVAALKKAGMYDNSIIVVTADHGDSLGERGRWGHAYTLFPEIVRIPLLIHLPEAVKSKYAYNPKSVAFLTDITPSLYYLLGEKPANDPMLGRPLFTTDASEQDAYARDSYLVVSSYAPVYGVLDSNGRMLYIADGVNYRDYYYDLSEDSKGASKPISDDLRRSNEARIRKLVLQIAKFYRLP